MLLIVSHTGRLIVLLHVFRDLL